MRRKIIVGVLIIFACAAIVSAGALDAKKEKKNNEDLYKQIGLFSDTLSIIRSDYVDEINFKDLIYGALKGMLSSLDPHSQFLDPDTYSELKVDTEGRFGGLGIEITIKDGLLTVVTPIEDTPAWKVGLKANDKIVKIEEELTRDMSLTEAVKRLRGKPGSAVNITVLRESEKRMIEFRIVRDIIKIKDIKESRILEDGIGYLRLIEFRENTANDLNTSINKLKNEGLGAFILDLRNNPGGLLDAAVEVTGKFVERGSLIVSTKGRRPSQNLRFISRSREPLLDIPMVVLINEGSASGSEIVAGALQDYKRAIILGTKSFGKGSVQTVIPLRDGSALRLTTSKYFTPSGKQIHGVGVIPDIVAENVKIEIPAEDKPKEPMAEEVFKEIEKKEKEKEIEADKSQDYKKDIQIMRAVDVLKAIMIYKKDHKQEAAL